MIGGLSRSMEDQVSAIRELSSALATVNELSGSISAATGEQSESARQVSRAVENVSELTQSAASSAEELSLSTQELTGLAQKLQGLVGQFKVNRPAIPEAWAAGGSAADAPAARAVRLFRGESRRRGPRRELRHVRVAGVFFLRPADGQHQPKSLPP